MRAAFDEVMRAGVQHQRSAAEKTARSIRYQMSAAQFPVMKHLAEFDFDATSVNEAQVA